MKLRLGCVGTICGKPESLTARLPTSSDGHASIHAFPTDADGVFTTRFQIRLWPGAHISETTC
jgi:hypothetical protein